MTQRRSDNATWRRVQRKGVLCARARCLCSKLSRRSHPQPEQVHSARQRDVGWRPATSAATTLTWFTKSSDLPSIFLCPPSRPPKFLWIFFFFFLPSPAKSLLFLLGSTLKFFFLPLPDSNSVRPSVGTTIEPKIRVHRPSAASYLNCVIRPANRQPPGREIRLRKYPADQALALQLTSFFSVRFRFVFFLFLFGSRSNLRQVPSNFGRAPTFGLPNSSHSLTPLPL